MARKSGTVSETSKSKAPKKSLGRRRDDIPDLYQEMLAEAMASSSARSDGEARPVKRRRVGERIAKPMDPDVDVKSEHMSPDPEFEDVDIATGSSSKPQQIAYNDSEDSQDDDDMDWEEVELLQDLAGGTQSGQPGNDSKSLEIDLSANVGRNRAPTVQRRKPATASEKRLRLDIHKTYLLCLLAHVQLRNHWCNDVEVQAALKPLLTRKTVNYLNPDEDKSQFQRSRSFMEGLEQACDVWRQEFKITACGMKRPYWAEDEKSLKDLAIFDDAGNLLDKSDFRKLAGSRTGSRDTGAQLFCALLRSVAVEARVVCSLQVLPFTGVSKGMTPEKPKPDYIYLDHESQNTASDDGSSSDNLSTSSAPPRIRRLGQPSFAEPTAAIPKKTPPTNRRRPIKESPYPVYWVEAFNEAVQKWVPVDPLVTHTIAKPSKFEPPASDSDNNMSYVISFEDDASAIDVTRRYAKYYNAKTRKNRVESTKDGERWWRRTMRYYEKPFQEDRDQVELGELTAKVAAEPMPRNVQDFKDHPFYALERHLRRNEVIHPKREVGKVSAGRGMSDKALEPIYRRRDVHTVRSADGWYRLGRDIKVGEQPLKRAAPRLNRSLDPEDDGDPEDSDNVGAGLYVAFQTEPYNAPPIVNGRVPKNAYGNLDIYVPRMVPEGGFHLPHPEAARAAKILGIDYADAVTGFEFKGRHGTAVLKGIVAAMEYRDALLEVLMAFADEQAHAEEERRTYEALRMWKRFLVALRIKERLKAYGSDGNETEEEVEEDLNPEDMDSELDAGEGGGFFPGENQDEVAQPTANRFQFPIPEYFEPEPDRGFEDAHMMESAEDSSILLYVPEDINHAEKGKEKEISEGLDPDQGGGFLPENLFRDDGGGFVLEDADHAEQEAEIPSDQNIIEHADPRPINRDEEIHVSADDNAMDVPNPNDLEESNPPKLPSGFGIHGSDMTHLSTDHLASNTLSKKDIDQEPAQGISIERTDAVEPTAPLDSDSELDQGSLLSHDPEDEDADPEWGLFD